MATGEFPEDWKRTNITPVFKKGKKEGPGNYRSVSLTVIPEKVIEKDRTLNVFSSLNFSDKTGIPGIECGYLLEKEV